MLAINGPKKKVKMDLLKLNNEEILEKYFDCDSVGDFLKEVKKQFDERNEIICGIVINGCNLSEDEELESLPKSIQDIKTIEFEYCSQEEFHQEFLVSTKLFLRDIIQVCPHLSESIQDANYAEFHKNFTSFVESVDSFTSALVYIQNNISDLVDSSEWRNEEKKMSGILQHMLDAYTEKDYVAVTDIIMYEMVDQLKRWYRLIDALSKSSSVASN